MGDARTYDYVLALRAVTSVDGMTAEVYNFEPKFLCAVSDRIINEVRGINRVVYDYTSKPPEQSSGSSVVLFNQFCDIVKILAKCSPSIRFICLLKLQKHKLN